MVKKFYIRWKYNRAGYPESATINQMTAEEAARANSAIDELSFGECTLTAPNLKGAVQGPYNTRADAQAAMNAGW